MAELESIFMIKKLYLPTFFSLLLLTPFSLFASGAYTPSSSSTNSGADYNKGKAIFNGRSNIGDLAACKSCHASKNRFKRGRLKEIQSQLADKIISCEIHQPCYQDVVTKQQIDQLVNYITRRYRLN